MENFKPSISQIDDVAVIEAYGRGSTLHAVGLKPIVR
jgi:hypothetical protein